MKFLPVFTFLTCLVTAQLLAGENRPACGAESGELRLLFSGDFRVDYFGQSVDCSYYRGRLYFRIGTRHHVLIERRFPNVKSLKRVEDFPFMMNPKNSINLNQYDVAWFYYLKFPMLNKY